MVEVVLNPAAGSGLAESVYTTHLVPLLGADELRVHRTTSAGDGVRIGRTLIHTHTSLHPTTPLDIILVGGDGTTHEILNGILLSSALGSVQVRLAVVPAGTANALFAALYPEHWMQDVQHRVAAAHSTAELDASVVDVMLRSVKSLAASLRSGTQGCVDLPLMHVDLGSKQIVAHLVTSHALHAAILHDADTPAMRARHTGIDRFKAAAALNATRWTNATLTLHPPPSGIQQYSPKTSSFERIQDGKVVLEGPFLYLNAMLTDRLESAFIPAPLSSALRLPKDAVDVVVIRPTRDPALTGQPNDGETFAQTRLGPITAGMYAGGTHIDLTYDSTLPMVEYFRCAGYDLHAGGGDKDRLVCTDGFVSDAEHVKVTRWQPQEDALPAPLIWR